MLNFVDKKSAIDQMNNLRDEKNYAELLKQTDIYMKQYGAPKDIFDAKVLCLRSSALQYLEKFKESLEFAKQATRLFPEEINFWGRLARSLKALFDNKLLTEDDFDLVTECYFKLKDITVVTVADSSCYGYLEIKELFDNIMWDLRSSSKMSDHEKLLKLADEYLKKYPETKDEYDAEILSHKSFALQSIGDLNESLKLAKIAINKFPGQIEIWGRLAVVLKALYDKKQLLKDDFDLVNECYIKLKDAIEKTVATTYFSRISYKSIVFTCEQIGKICTIKYDKFPKYLTLLTSLSYELRRHSWDHEQCERLVLQLRKDVELPISIRELIDSQNTAGIRAYLESEETRRGTYFGDEISDDSDLEKNLEFVTKTDLPSRIESLSKTVDESGCKNLIPVLELIIHAEKEKIEFCVSISSKKINKNVLSDIALILSQDRFPAKSRFHSLFGSLLLKIKQEIEQEHQDDAIRYKRSLSKAIKALLKDSETSNALAGIDKYTPEIEGKLKKLIESFLCIEYRLDKIRSENSLSKRLFEKGIDAKQKEALDKLNEAIQNNDTVAIEKITTETKFVVAVSRGITYLTSRWNKPSRMVHRQKDENKLPQFACGVFSYAGIDIFHDADKSKDHSLSLIELQKLQKRAEIIRKVMLNLKNSGPVAYQGYAFCNLLDLMQHYYSGDYDSIAHILAVVKTFLMENKEVTDKIDKIIQDESLFISFGAALHSYNYAFGIKPYKGHEDKRLRPRWRNDGRAERPHSGKTYSVIYPVSLSLLDNANFVPKLSAERRIYVNNEIVAEEELAFFAYLEAERVYDSIVAKYPSFDHLMYLEIFLERYGLSEPDYEKFKAAILATKPHTIGNKYVKQILGMWLSRFHTRLFYEKALAKAHEAGSLLVFMGNDGLFYFKPQIPSIRNNSGTEEKKQLLDEGKSIAADVSGEAIDEIIEISQDVYNQWKSEQVYVSGRLDESFSKAGFSINLDEFPDVSSIESDSSDDDVADAGYDNSGVGQKRAGTAAADDTKKNILSLGSLSKLDKIAQQVKNFYADWDKGRKSDADMSQATAASKKDLHDTADGKRLAARVNQYGLALKDVDGDGNCFFYAVLDQLKTRCPHLLEPGDDHNSLRAKATQELINSIERGDFAGFSNPEEIVIKLSENNEWADGIAIEMLAKALQVTIVLINSSGRSPTTKIDRGNRSVLYLGYHVGVHFESAIGIPVPELLAFVNSDAIKRDEIGESSGLQKIDETGSSGTSDSTKAKPSAADVHEIDMQQPGDSERAILDKLRTMVGIESKPGEKPKTIEAQADEIQQKIQSNADEGISKALKKQAQQADSSKDDDNPDSGSDSSPPRMTG